MNILPALNSPVEHSLIFVIKKTMVWILRLLRKRLYVLLLAMLTPYTIHAQSTLSGRVIDSGDQALPGVNILVLS